MNPADMTPGSQDRSDEDAEPNVGIYEAGIIQKGVNIVFFNDKKDEGVLYEQFYKPFPEVGLALILTAVSLHSILLLVQFILTYSYSRSNAVSMSGAPALRPSRSSPPTSTL